MSEQESLKKLLKPLVLFANSGEKQQTTEKPLSTTEPTRKRKTDNINSDLKPRKKPKQEKKKTEKITLDNFI